MNKTQKKTLFIVLAILAVLVIVFAIVIHANKSKEKAATSAAASSTALITDSKATYSSISFTSNGTTLSFAKDKNGNWYWTADRDFPLNGNYLIKIINTVSSLTPEKTITQGDTMKSYGLDTPAATLTVTNSKGNKTSFQVGDAASGEDSSYYMTMNGDQSKVYVIESTLHDELTENIYTMMKLPDLPILESTAINSIEVKGKKDTILIPKIKKSSKSGMSSVTWYAGKKNVTSNTTTTQLISDVSALSVIACESYNPSDGEVSQCGLKTPQATLILKYTDSKKKAQTLTITVGNKTSDEKNYCVRINSDSTIYTISSGSFSALLSIAANGISTSSSD